MRVDNWKKYNERVELAEPRREQARPEVSPDIAPSKPMPKRPNPFRRSEPVVKPRPKLKLKDILDRVVQEAPDSFKKEIAHKYGK